VALGFENDSGICAIIAIFAQLFYFAPLRRAALTFETTIERCNREGKKMRPVLSTEQKEAEQIMVEFRNLFQHIVESRDSCEIIPLIEKIAENCMIRADLSGNVTEEIFRCILQLEIPKVHDFISMPTVSIRLALNEFSSEIVESQITSGKVSVADARAAAIVVVKFGHYDSHKPTGYSFSYPETVYVESKAFDVYSIALREEHVKEKDLPKRLADIASGISVTNLAHALSAIRGKWQYRESNFSWRIFNNSNSYQISNEDLKQRTSGKFVTVPEDDHPVISFPNYVMYVERSLYNSFDWRFLNPAKE
jgi:hypothetical protein